MERTLNGGLDSSETLSLCQEMATRGDRGRRIGQL